MKKQKSKLATCKVNIRVKLAGLWIALILLYIYADLFSMYRPGNVNAIIAGFMGPLAVNQMTLLSAAVLMAIPILMILVCLFCDERLSKWANVITGALYLVVNIGNLIGETWAYYLVYGVLEIGITLLIGLMALKWPKNVTDVIIDESDVEK